MSVLGCAYPGSRISSKMHAIHPPSNLLQAIEQINQIGLASNNLLCRVLL